jgi:hypothetical protein
MIEFKTAEEFCELFGIDTQRGGADDFCRITSVAAALRYYALPGSAYAAALALMRARHWSPLILWKRMRHDLAPAFDAGIETLRALGVDPVEKEGGMTVCTLAAAVAAALADAGAVTVDRVTAEEIANALRQGRGK